LCTFAQDESESVSTNRTLTTCGDYDSATKNSTSNFVEILRFKHYIQKIYFVSEGDNYRNNVIKNHILVRVVIDLGYGNTFFDKSVTEAEPTQNSVDELFDELEEKTLNP